jgi:riboflavin kinase / FMN adenylyltransferase
MRTLVGLDALSPPGAGSAVAIGTFDGVHVGHRALIGHALRDAQARGLASVVLTWDRHPTATLRPGSQPPLLTSLERRAELIEELGADTLVVLAFDIELSRWPAERFATEVLARGLGARGVWVGRGWRFGRRAAGDVALLEELGERLGFQAHGVALAEVAGGPASSSRARAAVAGGDLPLAHALLGRPFDLCGTVVPGEGRGKSLGYPTANLRVDIELVRPARGIYAAVAFVGGGRHKAAVSVGVNPTFGGDESSATRIEAYLLGFDGDLYARSMRLAFHRRLREERKFDSIDELTRQMGEDVRATEATT